MPLIVDTQFRDSARKPLGPTKLSFYLIQLYLDPDSLIGIFPVSLSLGFFPGFCHDIHNGEIETEILSFPYQTQDSKMPSLNLKTETKTQYLGLKLETEIHWKCQKLSE